MKKKTADKFIVRQGDVIIFRTDETKVGKKIARDKGRVILAYGEVTGHSHAIADKHADLFALFSDKQDMTADGDTLALQADRILRAKKTVVLRHEEHAPIEIPAGNYRIRIQREYHPQALRNVAD